VQPRADRRTLAVVALVVLAVLWGYNWVVMKIAVHDASPLVFGAWRTLGGGIALLLAALALRRRIVPQFPAPFLWIGVFQTGLFIGLVSWASVAAGAGQVAMLAYTMPLWVSVIAWPVLGERLRLPHAIALFIALAGIVLMIGPRRSIGVPEVLALVAGFSWAIGVVIAKRLQMRERVDLFTLTMWQLLFGGAALAVAAAVAPHHPTVWNAPYVASVAYNIVMATAVAYFLWIFILNELPARDASMGTLANPVIGVIAAWIQLGETPSLLSGVGMVLILGGLALLSVAETL
jgi:drug/metabolite transporter (DMT)-like permease